jgi:hypothetical protein
MNIAHKGFRKMDDPGRTEAVVEVFVELTSIGLQVNAVKEKLGQQQNQFQCQGRRQHTNSGQFRAANRLDSAFHSFSNRWIGRGFFSRHALTAMRQNADKVVEGFDLNRRATIRCLRRSACWDLSK